MSRQGGGRGEETHKKRKSPSRTEVSRIQSLNAETHDSHLARLGGLHPLSIGTRKRTLTCTRTHIHTHLHQQSGEGARRWLFGSFAPVRTNVFFVVFFFISTTTVPAGFYKKARF